MPSLRPFSFVLSVLLAWLGAWGGNAFALTCVSAATGNWSAAATWAAPCNVAGGPVAADTVTIGSAHTVTVDGARSCASVTINALTTGGASTSQLAVDSGSLSVSGSITINGGGGQRDAILRISTGTATIAGNLTPSGTTALVTFTDSGTLNIGGNFASGGAFTAGTGTVNYNGTAAQSVGAYTYNNLTVNKSAGTATAAGALTVGGNFTMNAGTFAASTYSHSVAGNFSNSGTFTASTSTFTFNGAAAQSITGATTFYNLTVNNTAAVANRTLTINHDVTVSNQLTFTSGRIVMAGASKVIIPSGGSISGADSAANRFVAGRLQKFVPAGASTITFEVGTDGAVAPALGYSPVSLAFSGVGAGGGSLIAMATTGDHPQIASSGLDAAKSVNRWWTLTTSGVSGTALPGFTNFAPTFTFLAGDVDSGAATANFETERWNGVAWNVTTPGTRTATTTQATGVTALGEFAVAEKRSVAVTPGRFNAFESSTTAGAITGAIKTKISAQAFDLAVVAINTAGTAVETAFVGDVRIEVLDASNNTGALNATTQCRSSWVSLSPAYSATLTFATADLGRKIITFPASAVPNAWRDVRVQISFPTTSPTVTGCSTDNFAIRPNALASVSVSDQDWQTAYTTGTPRTLYNTSATGGNVHKAGRPFTLIATAVNAASTTTANYNGSPGASLTACLLPASGCTLGTLDTGTWSSSSGTVSSTTATYSEAGAFTMKLVDTSFADVDASDSSTAERYIESAAFNVGRFVPDHFALSTGNTPQFKTFNDTACATRAFTYIGQPFGYVTSPQATIAAKNAGGTTTANYRGALWKLAATDLTQTYGYTLTPASTPGLDTGLIGTPAVSSSNDGTGTATANSGDRLAFTRSATTPLAPFTAAITLSMSVADDSESGVAGNGTIGTAIPALFDGGGGGIAFDSGNAFRYGRLRLANAHGSELLDLPVAMETQYWNGTLFALNSADNCTSIAASNITMGNYQKNLAPCETAASISGRFSGGRSNLKLVKPGAGNNGSVDLTVNLGAAASGQTCVAPLPATQQAATAANQSYLQGKWSGTNYDRNPSGRATFGVYKNANEFIYMREMY